MRYLSSLAIILFILGLQFQTSLTAQVRTPTHPVSLEVYGQARCGDTKAAAANIMVTLESVNGGLVGQMLTDRDGKFRFSGLAAAQFTLTINASGYIEYHHTVDLLTQTSEYVNVFLVPETQPLDAKRTLKSIGYVDVSVPPAARKEFEKAQAVIFNHNNIQQARSHLEKAVTLYPAFFEAEFSLGTLYMDIGKWEQAAISLHHSIEINNKVPNAFFALGEVYIQQGHLTEAEKYLRAGLQLDNRSSIAHFALARIYWKQDDLQRSARQLALALQLNPKLAAAHLLGANVLLRAGKLEDAMYEFEEYLQLEPKGAYADQARATVQTIKQRLSTRR